MTDRSKPEGPPPRTPTFEQRRILRRLGIEPTDPWVWISTAGPVAPDRPHAHVDDGRAPRRISLTEEGAKAWNGYSLDLLGVRLDAVHTIFGKIQQWADDLTLDTRYMRARYQQSPLYAEYIASECEDEDTAIRGALLRHGAADRDKAWDSLKLILDDPPTGRLSGPIAMSDEDAFKEAVKFAAEWLDAHPDKQPNDFDVRVFAAQRCTSVDAATKWMKAKHFGIKQVRREVTKQLRSPK